MTLNRRRFLSISAACLVAAPAHAKIHRWQGRALGAEVEITLHAPEKIARPALQKIQTVLDHVERQFSLFDRGSALSTLNDAGRLEKPAAMFQALMGACDKIYRATNGLFDPTVQPLWRAFAEGRDPRLARALVGWARVHHDAHVVTLDEGQALTFNGIAQGFATDQVANMLTDAGLERTLVNVGEFRGIGGPWTLGIGDPTFGNLGTRTLTNGAIATSSPAATPLGGHGHILHGHAKPLWSTVSVEADTAVMADGFSTALTMAPLAQIRALKGQFGIRKITLVDARGDLTTV